MDRENSELIHGLLPKLTRAQATDERLWVTLAFREGLEYSVLRWGGEEIDIRKYSFTGLHRQVDPNGAISRYQGFGISPLLLQVLKGFHLRVRSMFCTPTANY